MYLALTTVSSLTHAERIARILVQERLASCVTILPGGTSLYWWNNAIKRAHEYVLLIKTRAAHLRTIEAEFRTIHPYDTPEFIAMPITRGSQKYFDWLTRETRLRKIHT